MNNMRLCELYAFSFFHKLIKRKRIIIMTNFQFLIKFTHFKKMFFFVSTKNTYIYIRYNRSFVQISKIKNQIGISIILVNNYKYLIK